MFHEKKDVDARDISVFTRVFNALCAGMTSGEFSASPLLRGAHEQIVKRDQDLDHDQRHDDHFKPHAALGIDDV
jgi:hypothetical protein